MKDFSDHDLVWLAMRAREINIVGGTPKSYQMEMDCQHELMQRYDEYTILGALVRNSVYTKAYLHLVD
jgi:hypothetical protein